MNLIGNKYFEENPSKVLGDFSISDYMNKIIVKGDKAQVESYFADKFSKSADTLKSVQQTDFGKQHIVFATMPKQETQPKPSEAILKMRIKSINKLLTEQPDSLILKMRLKAVNKLLN